MDKFNFIKINGMTLDNYKINRKGDIISIKRQGNWKEHLVNAETIRGYKRVNLYVNGTMKHYFVHRLVAETFIPNLENKPYIDHINTIRNDNRIENLRWVTHKENANNSISKINNSNSKIKFYNEGGISRFKSVKCINTGEIFKRATDATKKYRIDASSIIKCCRNKRQSAGTINGDKAVWRYLDE